MAKVSRNTLADLVTSKSIYMNGKKLSGVLKFDLDLDSEKDLRTKVNLTLAIKNGSFKVVRNESGVDEIHFDAFVHEQEVK